MKTKEEIEEQLKDIHSMETHAAIHTATGAIGLAAGGMAQIPTSDAVVITPIQIAMITAIGSIYDIRIGEAGAKSIIGGFSSAIVGRAVSQWMFGWMPGAGNLINVATAVALTETLGWYANSHFAAIKAEDIYNNQQMMADFVKRFETKIENLRKNFESGYMEHIKEAEQYHKLMLEVMEKYGKVRLTITDEENNQILELIQNSSIKHTEELKTKTFSTESPSFMMLKGLDELLDLYTKDRQDENNKNLVKHNDICFEDCFNNRLNGTFLLGLNKLVATYIK